MGGEAGCEKSFVGGERLEGVGHGIMMLGGDGMWHGVDTKAMPGWMS